MGMGGVCALLSRLVHIWVMYGMVMNETHHVFPGCGVDELLRVCQQGAFLMCHLSRCPADPSSWRWTPTFIEFFACSVRCFCRAFVTAPLMVASLMRGSLNKWLVAWCVWLCDGQPSCSCRVSAGDQPTSVSLPRSSGIS